MTQRPSFFRRALALLTAGLALSGAPAAASVEDQSLVWEGGFGAAAAVASLLYSPVKLVYAVGGIALGGVSFLWTWGDRDTLKTVVNMSLGGDYVITPEHLGGSKDLRFTGRTT